MSNRHIKQDGEWSYLKEESRIIVAWKTVDTKSLFRQLAALPGMTDDIEKVAQDCDTNAALAKEAGQDITRYSCEAMAFAYRNSINKLKGEI